MFCAWQKTQTMEPTPLMSLTSLTVGTVVARPSKTLKTPYVADVLVAGAPLLAHTASLGCGGLADAGACVLMTPATLPAKDGKRRCDYKVMLSKIVDRGATVVVGIYPKLAEELVERALTANLLSKLSYIQSFQREVTFLNSRFDFAGTDADGRPFILEVKNVPLADYEEKAPKEKRAPHCFDDRDVASKVGYFPDGFRKKASDTVSPRALKHIQELQSIKESDPNTRCIMCYVIQRDDVNRFQPSIKDVEYRNAFYEAVRAGVEVITLVVQWTEEGHAYFVTDILPVC